MAEIAGNEHTGGKPRQTSVRCDKFPHVRELGTPAPIISGSRFAGHSFRTSYCSGAELSSIQGLGQRVRRQPWSWMAAVRTIALLVSGWL
jgi:hypothetical protein